MQALYTNEVANKRQSVVVFHSTNVVVTIYNILAILDRFVHKY